MNRFSIYSNTFQSNDWYEVIYYPAGEMQVRITLPQILEQTVSTLDRLKCVIVARIYNRSDLIELGLLYNAIEGLGMMEPDLILPYLPFSRADRRFIRGDCNGLGFISNFFDNIAPLASIYTLDVHNKEGAKRLVSSADPYEYIEAAILHTAVRNDASRVTVLYPDEGAARRYKLKDYVGNNGGLVYIDVFHSTKKRDPVTGKLTGFEVPDLPKDQPILIVDDICDGGGTFLGVIDTLFMKNMYADFKPNVALYTTHSMYSKGTDILYAAGFDYLYTTNSFFKGDKPDKMVVYDCLPMLLNFA